MTTTTVRAGVPRPQSNMNTTAARRANIPAPNRSAEDPFAAANGTLRFANERKAAEAAARTAPAASTVTASRSTSSRSTSSRSTASRGASSRGTGSGSRSPKRRRRKKNNNRMILIALAFLILTVGILIAVIAISCSGGCSRKTPDEAGTPVFEGATPTPAALESPAPLNENTVIAHRAVIEGVNVQDLTVSEARERIEAALEAKKESLDITVAYQTYEPLTLTADTIGLDFDTDEIDVALALAASGQEAPASIPLSFSGELLRNALYELNDKIPNHAVNATATVKWKSKTIDGKSYSQPYWDFIAGENGAKIDFTDLENQITHALETGDYTASLTPSVTVSEPEVTVDALKSQLTLLSSYQTDYSFKGSSKDPAFDENCRGRDANISKAIGMMQVTELKPGERFSFNKKTGDRSEKNGWAYANAVYQGTGYRKETGGGVCQVSTTIFNAILRAGITDINRTGHSIPSDYVTSDYEKGLGFDATVDSNHIDFGFKNNTGHTIYMFIYITKNNSRRKNINVEIYGQKEEGVEYKVYNEILEKTPVDESKTKYTKDKTLKEGEKVIVTNPHDGYRVKTYVDKYKDGKLVKTVRTEETIYKVINAEYRIGVATATPTPTSTPKPTPTPKPTSTPTPESGEDEP